VARVHPPVRAPKGGRGSAAPCPNRASPILQVMLLATTVASHMWHQVGSHVSSACGVKECVHDKGLTDDASHYGSAREGKAAGEAPWDSHSYDDALPSEVTVIAESLLRPECRADLEAVITRSSFVLPGASDGLWLLSGRSRCLGAAYRCFA
jgi:hypothetical protein